MLKGQGFEYEWVEESVFGRQGVLFKDRHLLLPVHRPGRIAGEPDYQVPLLTDLHAHTLFASADRLLDPDKTYTLKKGHLLGVLKRV